MTSTCPRFLQCRILLANTLPSRFGNFIGEAEESEEESQDGAQAGRYVYDEDDEEEHEEPPNDQQLMQIDGKNPKIFTGAHC